MRIRASVFKAQHRPGTGHRRPLSNRPQTDATPEKQSPTATRQFSPRKFAPRITRLLLMGEATRIGLAPWLSLHNEKTRRPRSRSPTAIRQFSPRKFAPRIASILLVGEATRIGLAPWLSSQNEMDVYGRRVTTKILTSNIIIMLPLPVVYDLPSELGNSRVFSTTDLITGFFQCAINKDSIPLTAVCTQDGLWEWTVMPQGFVSSPGWFQSIMLRVREGLELVKLFIDDIVRFFKNGEHHVCDLRRSLERLTRFDLKLARHY